MNALGEYEDRHRPAIKSRESYNTKELETNERPVPPPRTIREHILAHQKTLESTQKQSNNKKNFFKINKESLRQKQLK